MTKNYLSMSTDRLKFKGQRIIAEIDKIKHKKHYLDTLDWNDEKYQGYELLSTPESYEDLQKGAVLIMGEPAAKQMFKHLGMEWI
jgi:hypothetical protein